MPIILTNKIKLFREELVARRDDLAKTLRMAQLGNRDLRDVSWGPSTAAHVGRLHVVMSACGVAASTCCLHHPWHGDSRAAGGVCVVPLLALL